MREALDKKFSQAILEQAVGGKPEAGRPPIGFTLTDAQPHSTLHGRNRHYRCTAWGASMFYHRFLRSIRWPRQLGSARTEHARLA